MRRERALACLAAGLLAACQPTATPQSASVPPRVCRVGPDGGPAIADRGIGGTGGPALADRGIGGTGIVAVITGFASICLGGQEVALPADVPVLVNARPVDPGTLRAGQVAVVEAGPGAEGLAARRVEIRFEVVGQVERIEGDRLRIAGQSVLISPQTLGVRPGRGDWVAVSGLREPDGSIAATRLEQSPARAVLVHGVLATYDGTLGFGDMHIGGLAVVNTAGTAALVGQPVTMSGIIVGDRLAATTIAPDLLVADPGAYFGPSIATVLVEGFPTLEGGRLRLGAFSAPASGVRPGGERGVFRFERAAGGLRAVGPAGAGLAAPSAVPRYEPAPLPSRSTLPATSRPSPDNRSGPSPRPPFSRQGRSSFGSETGPGPGPGVGR